MINFDKSENLSEREKEVSKYIIHSIKPINIKWILFQYVKYQKIIYKILKKLKILVLDCNPIIHIGLKSIFKNSIDI